MLAREHLDSNETLFFRRQLETIMSDIERVKYPEFKQRELIPVDFQGKDSKFLTYLQYDSAGVAQWIANYADDLPNVSINGKEFTATVKDFGASYSFSYKDIRNASKANLNLDSEGAGIAKRVCLQKEKNAAFYGDASVGIGGFLTNPNVTRATAPADGASSSTKFEDKTPDQILRDLGSIETAMIDLTNEIEVPDTMIMPPAILSYLKLTKVSSLSSDSILKVFLGNSENIKQIVSCLPCKEPAAGWASVGADFTGNIIVAYRRSPEVLRLHVPNDFEQHAPIQVNLSQKVNCTQSTAGVVIRRPLGVYILENV